MNQAPVPEDGHASNQRPHHDRLASVYDRWVSGDDSAEDCLGYYVNELSDFRGLVLELGIGTGRISRRLAAGGTAVIGIDHSLPMLAETRASGCPVPLIQGQFQALPFGPCFNTVILPMRTIGYFMTPEARAELFAEVHGVLRPGGRFIFDHYNIDLDWAQAHDGRPILMYADRSPGTDATATLIWDRYDYDVPNQRLHCTVRVERLQQEGDLLDAEVTEFDFAWIHHRQFAEAAQSTGFEVTACYGDFHGTPFSDEASHMIWDLRKSLNRAGSD